MLNLEKIGLEHNGRAILDDLNLRVAAGEIRFLVGASGAGKTTLLRIVAGFDLPDRGRVLIDDRLVSEPGLAVVPPHRRGLAMAFQDGALWPHMNVERHLRFGLDARLPDPAERDHRVDAVLALAGLEERRGELPARLSGGERQRLGLARALAHGPRLLLLDEPLAHLDLPAQRAVATRLGDWLAEHETTVLWVTHRPGEVAFVGGSVSLLEEGRIARELAAEEVPSWLATVGS